MNDFTVDLDSPCLHVHCFSVLTEATRGRTEQRGTSANPPARS